MTSSKKVFVANRRIFFSSTLLSPLTYRDVYVPVIMATAQDHCYIHATFTGQVVTGKSWITQVYFVDNLSFGTEQNISESGHISMLTYEDENVPSLFGSSRRS